MVFQGFPVSDPPESWKEMEKSVAQILTASGMDAEIQKTINLARGTVTVDVFAQPKKSLYGPIICECKYWNTAVPQEKVFAFSKVVGDSGASLGLLISRHGFQEGAINAARYSNLKLLSWPEFIEYIKPFWLCETTRRCLGFGQILLRYADPLDVPTHLIGDQGRAEYKKLLSKYRGFVQLLASLNIEVVSQVEYPAMLRDGDIVCAADAFVNNYADMLQVRTADQLFTFLVDACEQAVNEFDKVFNGFDLDDTPYDEVSKYASDLIDGLFPEGHSSSSSSSENEISRIQFEHQNARVDLIKWIRKAVRTG